MTINPETLNPMSMNPGIVGQPMSGGSRIGETGHPIWAGRWSYGRRRRFPRWRRWLDLSLTCDHKQSRTPGRRVHAQGFSVFVSSRGRECAGCRHLCCSVSSRYTQRAATGTPHERRLTTTDSGRRRDHRCSRSSRPSPRGDTHPYLRGVVAPLDHNDALKVAPLQASFGV